MRKTFLAMSIISAGLVASSAMAQTSGVSFNARADVVRVDPITTQVQNPRERCTTEYVDRTVQGPQGERNMGGTVLGGVAGALLGSQVGSGNGKLAATAAGAVAGAMVGDNLSEHGDSRNNRGRVERVPVERCSVDHGYETRTTGYRVTYTYQGREFSTVMPRSPGRHIDVEVSVTPRQY
jgi:uncharacterized protein YcfJ